MKYLFFIIIIYLSIQCNNDISVKQSNDSIVTEERPIDTTSREEINSPNVITPLPDGIYKTNLPCSNCPVIEHTVAFYNNNTYRLEEKKPGNSPSIIKSTGTFKPTNGIIYLYEGGIAAGRYQWKGDTLQYLKGNAVYVMQKQQSALDVQVWKNKKTEGLEFFGIGNEPFWNIEIDDQKEIAFHLAEWNQPMRFNVVKPIQSADSIVYKAKNNSSAITITIYNTFCSDGMSDNIYDSKVKVVYNNQTYKGCGILYK